MSATVLVANIALNTAESTISEFFSFCGKITALKVSPAADGQSLTGLITFESQSAAKTSLLLSNALINDKPITVQLAPEDVAQQLAQEPAAAQNPNIVNKPHEVPAELRSATSVVASMLATGYKLSTDALVKAKDLDIKTGFTQKVTDLATQAQTKLGELDQKYAITEKAKNVSAAIGEKATAIDAQYHISEKATAVAQTASVVFNGLARTASASIEALATNISQGVENKYPGALNKVKDATNTVTAVAVGISEETKAKIAQQEGYNAVPQNGTAAATGQDPLQPAATETAVPAPQQPAPSTQ